MFLLSSVKLIARDLTRYVGFNSVGVTASRVVYLALKLVSACGKAGVLQIEDVVEIHIPSAGNLLLCHVVCAINLDRFPIPAPLHFGGRRVGRAAFDADDVV